MNEQRKSQVFKETFLVSPRLVLTVFYFDAPTLSTPSQSWCLGERVMFFIHMDILQSAQHLLPPLCHTVQSFLNMPLLSTGPFSVFRYLLCFWYLLFRAIQTVMNLDLVSNCIFIPHGCVNRKAFPSWMNWKTFLKLSWKCTLYFAWKVILSKLSLKLLSKYDKPIITLNNLKNVKVLLRSYKIPIRKYQWENLR